MPRKQMSIVTNPFQDPCIDLLKSQTLQIVVLLDIHDTEPSFFLIYPQILLLLCNKYPLFAKLNFSEKIELPSLNVK